MPELLDVALTRGTYEVWRRVVAALALDWDSLRVPGDPAVVGARWPGEVAVERLSASVVRRLAARALDAGGPDGAGAAWTAAGGTAGQWRELDELLTTLRAHPEVGCCTVLVRAD